MFLKIVGYRNINWKSGSYQLKMKIIIIIKTSRTGPSGKNNVVSKFLSQPRKTEENRTQGSNQRLPAPLNPSSVPVSNTVQEGHSTIEPEPAGKTQQLGRSTNEQVTIRWFYTFKLQCMSYGHSSLGSVVYEVQRTRGDCALPNASYAGQTEELNFNQDEPTPTERSYLGTHFCSSPYCDRIIR